MTLLEIVNKIKALATVLPNVNTVLEGDIYDLNTKGTIKYNVVVITQQPHIENFEERTIQYHLYIFMVDKLLSNASNKLQIQSTAITNLHKIFMGMEDEVMIDSITYNTFQHKFADNCAGAYADVTITSQIDDCNLYDWDKSENNPKNF